MGLLDKLWDDTIGGPQPEKGVKRMKAIDIGHKDVGSPHSTASSPGIMSRFPFSFPYSPRSLPSSGEFNFKKEMNEKSNSTENRHEHTETRHISRSISIAKSSASGPSLDRSSSLPTSFPSNPSTPCSVSPDSLDRIGESVWDRVFKMDNNRLENSNMDSGKYEKSDQNVPNVFGWYNPID